MRKHNIERSDTNKQLKNGVKRAIVGAARSQEESSNGRGPAQAEDNRGRGQGTSGSSSCCFPAHPPAKVPRRMAKRKERGDSSRLVTA